MIQSRTTAYLTLALLTLVPGCLLLSPDEAPTHGVELVARASLSESALAKACLNANDLLLEDELRGTATVIERTLDGGATVGRSKLSVGDLLNGVRELRGQMRFPRGPVTSEHTLRLGLSYDGPLGRQAGQILGTYRGSIVLESGIVLSLDNLALLRESSPGVLEGGATLSFPDDPDNISVVALQGIEYDGVANTMRFGYQVPNIEWNDDPNDIRTITLDIEASFAPSIIFQGEVDLLDLVAGTTRTTVIDLDPVITGGATPVAQVLRGTVSVGFLDADPPSEKGTMRLIRSDEFCSTPTAQDTADAQVK